MATELQKRIRLVIAKENIKFRGQCLDQIIFQKQGLGLAAHHRDLNIANQAHHLGDSR